MNKVLGIILILFTTVILMTTPVYAINSIDGPDVVFKQTTAIVTINDILLLYSSDVGNISVSSDEYSGMGHLPGEYEVELEASDGLLTINRIITVKVVSDLGNVTLVGDAHDLYLRTDQILTFTSIRNILRNTGYIQIPVGTGYQMITDEYTGHESTPGVYDYGFRLISASGSIQNVMIEIYVTDDFTSFDPGDIIEPDPSPFDGFLKGLVDFLWLVGFVAAAVIITIFVVRSRKKRGFGQ